jgi:hypothetical protein
VVERNLIEINARCTVNKTSNFGQLASRIDRNGRRRSLRRPKCSEIKESSAPGRRRRR